MHIQVIHSHFSTPLLELVNGQCEEACLFETLQVSMEGSGLLSQLCRLKSDAIWGCWITVYDLGNIEEFVTLLLGAIYSKNPKKIVVALPQVDGKSWVHHQLTTLITRLQQASCPTVIVEFPLLFSEILLNQELLEKEQVLMLPLGGSTMSWIAPQELSRQFTYHLIYSQGSTTIRLAEHIFLGGRTIADSFTELLSHPPGEEAWALKRMQCIDLNEDQRLDREELTHYYKQLRWGEGEIQAWLSLSLGSRSYLAIEEATEPLESLLAPGDADPLSPFVYLHIPPAYSFQEWEGKEEIQEISLLKAMDYWEGNKTYPEAQEDSFSIRELDRWLETEYPHSQKVHVLPGLGILKTIHVETGSGQAAVQEITLFSGDSLYRHADGEKDVLIYEKIGQRTQGGLLHEWIHYEEDMRTIALLEGCPVYVCAESTWRGWPKALDLLIHHKALTSSQIQQFRSRGDLHAASLQLDTSNPSSIYDGKTYYFAGGIGVTAALAMIRSRGNRKNPQPLQLDWAVQDSSSLVFADELSYWTSRMPDFTWSATLTDKDGPLQASSIEQIYPFTGEGMAYICGSPAYVLVIFEGLKAAGWPIERIRRELFEALPHPEISRHINSPELASRKSAQLSMKSLS